MSVTELAPRRAQRRNRNAYGETWDQTQDRVNREFPATRDTSWVFHIPEERLFLMVGDLIKKPNEPGRRTHRELPEIEEARRLLRCFFDKGHTTLPFAEAFAVLAGPMSRRQLCVHVGLPYGNVARLIKGERAPRRLEMEMVASAFGKDPRYFAEYRSMLIAGAVHYLMECDPDRSAVLAQVIAL